MTSANNITIREDESVTLSPAPLYTKREPTFTAGEFSTVMLIILIPGLFYIAIALWLKLSGALQRKKAKEREEAEKTIFQRGDADITGGPHYKEKK